MLVLGMERSRLHRDEGPLSFMARQLIEDDHAQASQKGPRESRIDGHAVPNDSHPAGRHRSLGKIALLNVPCLA